jgi:hypothetical protein
MTIDSAQTGGNVNDFWNDSAGSVEARLSVEAAPGFLVINWSALGDVGVEVNGVVDDDRTPIFRAQVVECLPPLRVQGLEGRVEVTLTGEHIIMAEIDLYPDEAVEVDDDPVETLPDFDDEDLFPDKASLVAWGSENDRADAREWWNRDRIVAYLRGEEE